MNIETNDYTVDEVADMPVSGLGHSKEYLRYIVKACSGYIKRDSDNLKAYWVRGATRQLLGEKRKALGDLFKATFAPDEELARDAWFCIGEYYYDRSKYEAALDAFNKAADLGYDAGDIAFHKAFIYAYFDEHEASERYYEEAARHDPDEPVIYNNRGADRLDRKDYAAAMEDFCKAIELDSEYGKAYYNRAVVHRHLGMKDNAKDDLRMAVKHATWFAFKQAIAFREKVLLYCRAMLLWYMLKRCLGFLR